MDVAKLARGLALNRISLGAGLILAPRLYARTWIGADGAADDRAKLLARALGARDLVLGAGGLIALRDGDADRARQWFAAQGATDAVDLVATLVAGRDVPDRLARSPRSSPPDRPPSRPRTSPSRPTTTTPGRPDR